MGRRKRKRILIWVTVSIVFLLTVFGLMILLAPKPPQEELKIAREALKKAQAAGAEEYAFAEFKEAQMWYDSAMINWAVQNERFFIIRDYDKVRSFVNLVIEKSGVAEENTIEQVLSTNALVKKGLTELKEKINRYERYFKKLPLASSIINAHNNGKLKYSEAKIAYESERYNESKDHYLKALDLINTSNEKAEKQLNNWFSSYDKWKKNSNEAIRLSKSQKVILIDKYAHNCFIYQNGKQIKKYEAEFGINWMGNKQRRGDKATPEGIYKVTQKKERSQTKYHRALLINFPNEEDKRRKATGNLIEIHGLGGKGVDWTDGCVALDNSDMDELYRLVSVGTPVIIVGSMKSLNEILEEN